MRQDKTVEGRARRLFSEFIRKSGIREVEVRSTTDLIRDVGLTSLQGLEFVLELCDEFQFDFPGDFNPFVDDERQRGQTFGGLVKMVERHLANEGTCHEKR